MKLQSLPTGNLTPRALNAAPADKGESAPPPPPGDNYKPGVGTIALRTGISWGNATGTVVGGATGLATVTGALYAGVLGGAIVGSLTGAGFGPVLSSVTSHGAMDFIGRSFSTASFFAKTGMVMGGVAGAAGAWQVGNGIGNAVGKAAGFIPGTVVGAAKGAWAKAEDAAHGGGSTPPPAPKEEKPSLLKTSFTDLNNMSGGMKLYASVLGGVGMLSGAVGGATLGASVASAGSLLHGLAASNVTWSTIGAAGVAGGVVGGALFAAIGGLGGFTAAKASKHLWDVTGGKLLGMAHQGSESQNEKGKRLEAEKAALETREDTLKADAEGKRESYRVETKKLDERESQIHAAEVDVQGRLDGINGKIESAGQAQYKERAGQPDAQTGESLVAWNGRLETFDGQLKATDKAQREREGGIDKTIKDRSDAKFAEDRKPIERHYDELNGQLNAKEGQLNERDRSIDSRIDAGVRDGVAAQKPGLESDLRNAQEDKYRAQGRYDSAETERGSAVAQLGAAQSQYNTAHSEAENNKARVNRLRGDIRNLEQDRDSLQAEHRQADAAGQQLERDLAACKSGK